MSNAPVRRPRIADVAREAGVSKSAVSFAFNSPQRLSQETASRILAVAATLGYRPHPVARMLAVRQTTTIGILSPQPLAQVFANPFFPLFAQGVATVTDDRGFGLLFISPLHGSLRRAMERATVDGIVVIGLEESHPEVESIRGSHVPVILVDAPAWPEHGSVGVDDETGARAAAEHLVALGHRELLVVGVEPPTAMADFSPEGVTGRRLAGYRSVAADHGIELGRHRVVVGPATFEGGEQSFLRAWSDGLRPTGVLAMSDASAAGVVQGARHLGLKVPDDLSVVGFDDLPLSRFIDPPLTTVHQPVRLKGEEAARLLLLALSSPPGSPTGEHRILETRLVVRRSTAPPPEPARARG